MLDNSVSVRVPNTKYAENTNASCNQDRFIKIDGHIFNIKDIVHMEKVVNDYDNIREYYILIQLNLLDKIHDYYAYKTIYRKEFNHDRDLARFNECWESLANKLCKGE